MLNRQEVFDIVSTHLLTQMAVSELDNVTEDGEPIGCAYRGNNGLKCAIGILIKDEFYTPALETKNLYNVFIHGVLLKSGYTFSRSETGENSDKNFLMDLQKIHDRTLPHHWQRTLTSFAVKYQLAIPSGWHAIIITESSLN